MVSAPIIGSSYTMSAGRAVNEFKTALTSCPKESLYAPEYVCTCFFYGNVFIRKYKLHTFYDNDHQFQDEYRAELRMRGCSTEKQYAEVLGEVHKEMKRRKLYHRQLFNNLLYNKRYYRYKTPELKKLQLSFLDTRFVEIASDAKKCANDELLMNIVKNGGLISESEVYSFPAFTKAFCRELLKEIKNYEETPGFKTRPNTMNDTGISLDEMGLSELLIEELIRDYVAPLSKALFPQWVGAGIDSYKSFVVHYSSDGTKDLSAHYDNAEVSFNVPLNSDYSGGDLVFKGMQGEMRPLDTEKLSLKHEVGHGILHCGRRFHAAMPITNGQRYNLIIWMRSSDVRNKECPMCNQVPTLIEVPFGGDGFTMERSVHGSTHKGSWV